GGGGLVVKVQFVGTAASANQRFVNQTYLDLLQRPADPTGLAGWTNALTNGASRGQIIQAIQASLEYRQDLIDDLYGPSLHRKPDTAGRDGWVNLLGQGASLSSIRALFLGSAEYFQMRGQGSTQQFVQAIYHDVLGRSADSQGLTAWSQAAANPANRVNVAFNILLSA